MLNVWSMVKKTLKEISTTNNLSGWFWSTTNFEFTNSLIHEFWIFYEYSPPVKERKNQTILSNSWLFSDWKMGSHLPEGTLFSKLEIDKKTKHVPYYLTIYINCDDCIKLKKNTNINNYLYLNSMVIFIEVLHICGSFWLLAMSRDIFQAESWDVYG